MRASPLEQWSVSVAQGEIVTRDGGGARRAMAIAALRRVVVATDDSGPWGADVVFLLYADGAEPVGLFPLEARGAKDFVAWMSGLPGYQDAALQAAMGSTRVARFDVLAVVADGG
ncbi:hypothetical protein U1839_02235 [Sphingomonas sp. RT2P30]